MLSYEDTLEALLGWVGKTVIAQARVFEEDPLDLITLHGELVAGKDIARAGEQGEVFAFRVKEPGAKTSGSGFMVEQRRFVGADFEPGPSRRILVVKLSDAALVIQRMD